MASSLVLNPPEMNPRLKSNQTSAQNAGPAEHPETFVWQVDASNARLKQPRAELALESTS